jgi:hypothetical protein
MKQLVGFEVLTAVVMTRTIFWIKRRVVSGKPNDVAEEHIASIFKVE